MFKLALIAMLAAGIPAIPNPAKPNFSGAWKLNAKQGDSGPKNIVFKIDHKDPVLKYSASGETEEGESFTEEAELTTDGSDHPGPNGMQVAAHWEDETLVVVYGGDITMTLKLSADGKRMFRELMGHRETYDRQ